MEMSIDESMLYEMGYNTGFKDGIKGSIPKVEVKKFLKEGTKNVSNNVLAIVREDYIHKVDYEARLKADMAAMLTEIQLEIEEKSIIDYDEALYDGGECVISISEINDIIQQKINELRGGRE